MKKIVTGVGFLLSLPLLTFAQRGGTPFGPIGEFFLQIQAFIDQILIPLVFSVALLMFLYGMYRYFIQGGASEDDRSKGKQLILYSIIGFVLMVSIWGIVNMIALGLFGTTTPPTLPGTPTL